MSDLLKLHIVKLHCYRQDEEDGDEVFFKLNGKKIFPEKKKFVPVQEGKVDMDFAIPDIPPDSKITLELWEYDFWSPNDFLGSFSFFLDKRGGPYKTDLHIEKSVEQGKYAIEWKIENS